MQIYLVALLMSLVAMIMAAPSVNTQPEHTVEDESMPIELLEDMEGMQEGQFDPEEMTRDVRSQPSFIRFGKRAQPSFIRFGKRAQPSFIRFGKRAQPSFIRFG